MRTIAHISDLHFGREDRKIAEALLSDLTDLSPSLIVVSGDLTQRARNREFVAAQDYLKRLPAPCLIVPGNHDIPLYNLLDRLAQPLKKFQKYINDDLNPTYIDEEIAVLGVNTARALNWKKGSISFGQILEIEEKFCPLPESIFKVVVTHHQFIPPPGKEAKNLISGGSLALEIIETCGIDLMLAGHLHLGYTGDIRVHYPERKRSIIVAHAGTSISKRRRGEPNAYNLITITPDTVSISIRLWNDSTFSDSLKTSYKKQNDQWVREG